MENRIAEMARQINEQTLRTQEAQAELDRMMATRHQWAETELARLRKARAQGDCGECPHIDDCQVE